MGSARVNYQRGAGMKAIAFALGLAVSINGFGQTPSKDPEVLQSLLAEVRQLRLDVESITVA